MTEHPFALETLPANLEKEMRQSYLDYAMSVIVGRALPDLRDGLKPVHRRVLYAMLEAGNDWNKAYKKSARIVGEVIGKYHPHGDSAVYDTIVRMAQSFSMRYTLIDGQGNFGSIDGDAPAAMRYTEIRLSKIAHELLVDIDKNTVDFGPNYDETESQPLVLPTRIPNLLINGSAGIAVGMATNIPPHNLGETIDACLALIENPDVSIEELMKHLPGPDFPTAGIICGSQGIREAYETGRGRVYVRAKTRVETPENGRDRIIVEELPYQVNKARLMEKIAELVRNKRIEGIAAIRDESDKSGMRMVIEIKRGEQSDVLLNNLFTHTQMQTVFGINMVALNENQPNLFSLKEVLEKFVSHRREVVTRRTIFELGKARERAHTLEGLAVALSNIDEVIALIRSAKNAAQAKEKLLARPWGPGVVEELLSRGDSELSRPAGLDDRYGINPDGYRLSPEQAQAILDLRLQRLTGLERDKIIHEYTEIIERIRELLRILENPDRLLEVICEELRAIRKEFNEPRRTEILEGIIDLSLEDLIPEEDLVVTISRAGYAKAQKVSDYSAQKRGGKGRIATRTKEEDFVQQMFVANSHDTILCFSSVGKVYWLRTFQLPQAGRQARGRPLVNLLPLEADEQITAILPIREYDEHSTLVMVTSRGQIKRCRMSAFSRPRSTGLIAVKLPQDDYLIAVAVTDGTRDVMLISDAGRAVRFPEGQVRVMGRTALGVRGIRLDEGGRVISLMILPPAEDAGDEIDEDDSTILICTENGYGNRTSIGGYPRKSRGGKGVIAIKTSERNGKVIGAHVVENADGVMLITDGGILIRTPVGDVSVIGRNTQGVRLISLNDGEALASLSKIVEPEEEAEGAGDGAAEADPEMANEVGD
ncbi:MAG: DNA gyrase subunit A [Gammaproteobacteria bacterium]|nr:DNA gyrase subunit A [Gammaproteobacteria bacterium]MYJ51108.1 DNA gyrase subunit A [Gammaproteobacteria bacterium]